MNKPYTLDINLMIRAHRAPISYLQIIHNYGRIVSENLVLYMLCLMPRSSFCANLSPNNDIRFCPIIERYE